MSTKGTLSEQILGRSENDVRYAGLTVTPQQIRKAINDGLGMLQYDVSGHEWLIRSDFPVLIYADGEPLGLVGPYPNIPDPGVQVEFRQHAPWIRLRRAVKTFGFALYGGFGGTATGEVYKIHGACVVEGAAGAQIEPMPVDPLLLPSHCFKWTMTLPAGSNTATKSLALPDWEFLFTTAKELWIKGIGVIRTAGGAPSNFGVRSIEIAQADNPAGDAQTVVKVMGMVGPAIGLGGSWWAPIPPTKLCILSHFAKYEAANNRSMSCIAVYDSTGAAETLEVAVNCSYRM